MECKARQRRMDRDSEVLFKERGIENSGGGGGGWAVQNEIYQ